MCEITIRKVDKLGRVVLPIEARREMGILPDDKIEVAWENGHFTIRKICTACLMCGSEKELTENGLCKSCIEKIKAN